MKITFKPLDDPAPVRPADMPEAVAFEYEFFHQVHVGIREGGLIRGVRADGTASLHAREVCAVGVGKVLSRRDGQPLPHYEPVPLHTLDPFPVWYRRGPGHTWWYQHDGVGGYMVYTEHTGEIEMHSDKGKNINVSPAPYIMEVRP